MEELKELFLNVEDTYDDFVGGVCCSVKGHEDEIAEMIRPAPALVLSKAIRKH